MPRQPLSRRLLTALLASALLAGCLAPGGEPAKEDPAAPSPYVDQLDTAIRGLTAEEIDDLRNGRGMGLARAAELNGYPGPAHVLELADALNLTSEQRTRMQTLHDDMRREARALGERILATHAELGAGFREHAMNPERLDALVTSLEADARALRLVHLGTHLDAVDVLTHPQTVRYHELRGYGEMNAHGDHAGHHGSADPGA